MAYTPINWQTGDTITAEKMNKMDNGWGVSSTQLFNETVATEDTGRGYSVGAIAYSTFIDAESLSVTFDNIDYVCPKLDLGGNSGYGGFDLVLEQPDFTDYPFFIFSKNGNQLITQTAGSHTIKANATGVEISSTFNDVVNMCIDGSIPMQCVDGVTTASEMNSARASGRLMFFYATGQCHFVINFNEVESATAVDALPAGVENVQTYGFTEDGEGNLIFRIFVY